MMIVPFIVTVLLVLVALVVWIPWSKMLSSREYKVELEKIFLMKYKMPYEVLIAGEMQKDFVGYLTNRGTSKELRELKRQVFYKIYPRPVETYLKNQITLVFSVISLMKKLSNKVVSMINRRHVERELVERRARLKARIQDMVFKIWGDSYSYNAEKVITEHGSVMIPVIEYRDGFNEVGVRCDIYSLQLFGDIPESLLSNFNDRFKSEVDAAIVKTDVLELESRKELVFLLSYSEDLKTKQAVGKYLNGHRSKRSNH
jgi:hypothetical protein